MDQRREHKGGPLTHTVFSRISRERLHRLLGAALDEDLGSGDITSHALVPPDLRAEARLLVKQEGVLAGVEVCAEVFRLLDPAVEVTTLVCDGARVRPGDVPLRVGGSALSLLAGERTALNFVQKMSGVATATARLAAIAVPYGVRVNHIRKTAPVLRALEVYAVRVGGGAYNRFGLFDGVLIKDNHLAVAKKLGLSIEQAVERCRAEAPLTVKVGLEVKDLDDLPAAIRAAPDYLALDNMTVEQIALAVREVGGSIPIDVTGSVNESNLEAICRTGIQMVGVGGITHSAPSLDVSLEIQAT